MKKRNFKIIYKSNWETATKEQKEEFQKRIDMAYDYLFDQVVERKKGKLQLK